MLKMVMKQVQRSHLCKSLYISFIFLIISDVRCCVADGKIFITMVTRIPSSGSTRQADYFCFVNSPELDVTVSTRRVISTRKSSYFNNRNPDPPRPQQHSSSSYPSGAVVYWIDLSDFSYGYEFGTYACDVTWNDGTADHTTSVSNIIMLSYGLIYPADGLVTKTVNEGDNGVSIEMTVRNVAQNRLNWRRNENTLQTQATSDRTTYSIFRAVQEADAGVYICYEYDHFDEAGHGMQRLIVRGCQANRWGPNCYGICDNCYNGGVCDDETGRCICPPGFMGDNCLTACGPNRFGYNCEFTCSSSYSEYSCVYRQFCLIDPYGCSCSAGLAGWNCGTVCGSSKFGASCLQDCHCLVGECNDFTGRCQGACEEGFSGQSCQIPDICPTDYYGPQCLKKCHCKDDVACDKETGECPNQECSPGYTVYTGSVSCQECQEGYFGDCQQECRCEASACDKVTGACSGRCKSQWVDYLNCEEGLVQAEADMVNPNTAAQVNCTVEGSRTNQRLSRKQNARDEANISTLQVILTNEGGISRRTTVFQVDNVENEEQLYCLLTSQSGITIYAYLPVTISVYNLPELTYPPELVNKSTSEVTIQWTAWNPDTDVGDAPVLAYVPYYRRNSSDEWLNGLIVQSEETLIYRVADLDTDTSYVFAVAAVREGSGGEGPRSPFLLVKTLCDAEPSTPVDVKASLTRTNQVRVTWQVTENIMCSTGISNFSVYYVIEGSGKGPEPVTTVTADVMETVIESNDLGEGRYTFYVTFTTDVESILSIQDDKSTNATVYLKKKEDAFSDGISGNPPIALFIIPVAVAFLLLSMVVVVLMLLRMKKKQREEPNQNMYENAGDDKNKAPVSNLSEEYEGIKGQPDQSEILVVDIKKQTASLKRNTTLEEYHETEGDSEDEDGEHIYGNLQPPEPIKVSMFEDYVTCNANNLEQEFEILKKGKQHPWTIAENEIHKKKNRFKNMLTYDHSRVILSKISGDPSSDYYNASYIKDQNGEKTFIASQGPNTASLDDFWRMVWEQNVSTVVMITNLYEGGKERCAQYWPEVEGSSKLCGNIEIEWSRTISYSDFIIRKISLHHLKEKDKENHQVNQFHFLTWPDMSVPKEVTPVLEFVKQVKQASKERETPTLVHCSAGIGRTGTFIALSCLMDVLMKEKVISVFDFVEKMRENRINMVQTSKQYLFLYKCLLEFHQTQHTEIPVYLFERFDLKSKRDVVIQEHKLLTEIGDVILKIKRSQDGLKEGNRPRNRFPDKVPYDGSRPFLDSSGSGGNREGYINAAILKSFTNQDAFISTQSPLPNTVEDFWKMVFDWNCPLIVMLNQLDPIDKTCIQYWSEDSAEFGSMTVTCLVKEDKAIFTRRVFEIFHVHSEDVKTIHHLQLHSWPPKGNLSCVLGLIQEVQNLQQHLIIVSPIVVHCIDGVGRCGTFVTVISELQRIARNQSIDVFSTVRQLRQRHPDFLSNKEDYLLCYELLKAHVAETCEYQNL